MSKKDTTKSGQDVKALVVVVMKTMMSGSIVGTMMLILQIPLT